LHRPSSNISSRRMNSRSRLLRSSRKTSLCSLKVTLAFYRTARAVASKAAHPCNRTNWQSSRLSVDRTGPFTSSGNRVSHRVFHRVCERQRKLGEMLLDLKKSGGLKDGKPKRSSGEDHLIKLSDIGVTKNDSSLWQQLASIPKEKYEGSFNQVLGIGPP
jgi:hypothetical protein